MGRKTPVKKEGAKAPSQTPVKLASPFPPTKKRGVKDTTL